MRMLVITAPSLCAGGERGAAVLQVWAMSSGRTVAELTAYGADGSPVGQRNATRLRRGAGCKASACRVHAPAPAV